MCAYKLCKVEFRYWGMQSKIERFIHDVALRKTMLKAHSQVGKKYFLFFTIFVYGVGIQLSISGSRLKFNQ